MEHGARDKEQVAGSRQSVIGKVPSSELKTTEDCRTEDCKTVPTLRHDNFLSNFGDYEDNRNHITKRQARQEQSQGGALL